MTCRKAKSHGHIQVIIVDDHSTDNSMEVLSQLAEEYENVKVYQVPEGKKGVSYARNIAIDSA